MKKETIFEAGLWALAALPFVYLAVVWNQLPEQVPTHFNVHGEADDFSSKTSLPWMLAGVVLFPLLLLRFIPQIDPRRKAEEFGENYSRIRLIITLFMVALGCIIIHSGYQKTDVGIILPVLIGALYAGIGNYISSAKSNYFVGIRTPWTLENEDVWRKTHRLGGRMMFWSGVACIAMSLILPAELRFVVIAVLLGFASLIPVIYSYVAYRKVKG